MKTLLAIAVLVAAAFTTNQASAEDSATKHWIARLGVHPINPKPNSHTEFELDNSSGLSAGATYLFTRHWALELFGSFPTATEMHANDERVGRFEMVPTSATVQYHITDASGIFRAYVGAGAVYTMLGNERSKSPLLDQSFHLDDSIGMTLATGLDMSLGSKWFVNVDARWMDIDSRLSTAGAKDTLEIDPFSFGLSIGRHLR